MFLSECQSLPQPINTPLSHLRVNAVIACQNLSTVINNQRACIWEDNLIVVTRVREKLPVYTTPGGHMTY